MYATLPVSWPIAKMLDIIFGEHTIQRFKRQDMSALIDLHSKEELLLLRSGVPANVVGLDRDITYVLSSALSFN